MGRIERASGVLLMCVVVAVAVVVTRDFVRYTDYYPYLAVDDALGNVSYNLATYGQYGFPTSPIQGFTDVPRNHAFFNYGPWYFYAGAGLIWLFGYSIGVLRALHLLGILAIGATACWWFGRRRQAAPGALVALGVLYSFDVGQWPMVRPDIAVSVFAVLFIVAAGWAIEHASHKAWFVAGLAAGCAAFTHLIAWALVPCCLFTLALALVNDWPGKRRALVALLSVAAGFAAAVLMFYASFGFRVRDHLAFLRGYSGFLDGSDRSQSALALHLQLGFWYVNQAARIGLAAAVVAGAGLIAASSRWSRATRTPVLAVLLPAIAVACFYVASLAFYPSYHTGYTILILVAVVWCAAAVISTALSLADQHRPALSKPLALAIALILLVAGATQLYARAPSGSNPRFKWVREWVGIEDYTARVGELITRGATAWGTIVFGIDSPGRFEIVDTVAAVSILQPARLSHAVDTQRIAPAYLIWGYSDNRENTMDALNPTWRGTFGRVRDALNPFTYRLIGLVAAAPYGVTRVYRRMSASDDVPQRLPALSVYNPATQTWDRRLEGPLDVRFVPADPVRFDLRFEKPGPPVQADKTMRVELAEGRYLFRVRLQDGSASIFPSVLAVTSAPAISETVGDLGPSVDVSPYARGDGDAYVIHTHHGGTLYISQIDKGRNASIDSLEAYRILPALHDDQRADRNLFLDLPVDPWVKFVSKGVEAQVRDAGVLAVTGDRSAGGFQITSPEQPATAHSIVTLRTAFAAESGRVCVGALNGDGMWLANGGDPRRDFTFTVDQTGRFRVVFYNCNPAAGGDANSRFTVSRVRYAVQPPEPYADELLAVLNPGTGGAPVAAPNATLGLGAASAQATVEDVQRIQIPVRSNNMRYRAPIVTDMGDSWLIKGEAEGRFAYVLRADPMKVTDFQLVVKGVVKTGGITVGLLKDEQWAASVNVSSPGPFAIVIAPPVPGSVYDIIVAHNIDKGPLTTDVTLERIGWSRIPGR